MEQILKIGKPWTGHERHTRHKKKSNFRWSSQTRWPPLQKKWLRKIFFWLASNAKWVCQHLKLVTQNQNQLRQPSSFQLWQRSWIFRQFEASSRLAHCGLCNPCDLCFFYGRFRCLARLERRCTIPIYRPPCQERSGAPRPAYGHSFLKLSPTCKSVSFEGVEKLQLWVQNNICLWSSEIVTWSTHHSSSNVEYCTYSVHPDILVQFHVWW